MSTRTTIRIGSLVDQAMKQRLPGFKRVLEEYTSQFFFFGYRQPVHQHYYATILFQASKSFGGVTCEVGVSRTEDFPYYRFFDRPELGVHGFRARTRHVLKDLEANTTKPYTGPDTLMAALMELTAEAASASHRLVEMAIPRIAREYTLWQPLYAAWQEAESRATEHPERRYPDLVGEVTTRRLLHRLLQSGDFDGFLGPRKFRYREPQYLHCHVFLMAKALAFVDPPEAHEVSRLLLDPGQDPDKILFDPISSLTGRTEQDEAIPLSSRTLERVPQWAFLRSAAALEAFFDQPLVDLTEVKDGAPSAANAGASQPDSPVAVVSPGLSLDELYGDAPVLEGTLGAPEGPELELVAALTEAKPCRRPDPFESILPYLQDDLSGPPPQTSCDPFELLGAQFGL